MAIVSRKVSDLSGNEGNDEEFAQVIVRQHPKLDQPKALDVLTEELAQFKDIGDLVVLEARMPDGSTRDIHMRLAEFNKLGTDMDGVLSKARGTRGRVPGTRIGS
ncbi:hypothetical protein SAMN04489729_5527 [Amycolatopsis lurida]|uniref:Uncharacterized protein n=1 Tax=Amycolatopsis lurida NRRL 2430 TaxID=1460371 RepID=A0A2P2FVP5_AMYLU|nr:hypothetical protein [Amycolatopsis lurida]KFU80782.1 hypothetical protein BB31_12590 [Amycolatopsis lurida NRRL 2430]SED86205.1 hypothetical protein SAMN04489729_5527 [Amycolatopsis lurida]